MESDVLSIGKKIKLYRTRNNLTIDELAEKLNVSRQIVSRWEHGKSMPKFDTAIDIAKQLNVKLEDLTPSKEKMDVKDIINMI